MEKGRLLESGKIDDIISRLNRRKRITVVLLETDESAARTIEQLDHVTGVESSDAQIEVEFSGSDRDVVEMLRSLVNAGLPVMSFTERRMGVEDILLHVGAKEVS
jgi:hypothetical protein